MLKVHLRRLSPMRICSSGTRRRMLAVAFLGCLIPFLLYGLIFQSAKEKEDVLFPAPVYDIEDVMGSVLPPHMPLEKLQNAGRTLFFLPGKENRCTYQYDYVCKFWFYIRCYVYAAFPNVQMLSPGPDAASEFMDRAHEGDIALIVWRSKNHSIVPQDLSKLLAWRNHATELTRKTPRVRIGVFHIANEKERAYWPWYTLPDFIIRNYWLPQMPPHVAYVPLGPQLPNQCIPRSTENRLESLKYSCMCDCRDLNYKRTSKRRYLWSFTGSLRKNRAELLRRLRRSPEMQSRGFAQVTKKFGGDGVFGSVAESPKNAYLDSILETQFVFAPCGNVMETHRIYEALSLGAIPVIENCEPDVSHFFPFTELLIDGGPEQMINFVMRYTDRPNEVDHLQQRVTSWWLKYVQLISRNVSRAAQRHVPATWKWAP